MEPKDNPPKLGILSSSIVADFFYRKYSNLELKVSLNLLDSIRERKNFVESFLKSLNYLGINENNVWIDSQNTKTLLDNINSLKSKGLISIEKRRRLISYEKKVEVLGNIPISPRSRFIKKIDEFYYDTHRRKLTPIENKVLIFRSPPIKTYPTVFPPMMKKEFAYHFKKVSNIEMLVSRERETGFRIKIENQIFNLDIDFLLGTYLYTLMKDKGIGIVIGSNHTAWHSTLAYSLFKSLERRKEKRIVLYFLPYILPNSNDFSLFANGEYLKRDPNLSRLLILSSLSPHKKNVYWPENFLDSKISRRIEELKKSVFFPREKYSDNLYKITNLLKKTNIEKAIKIRKDYNEELDIDIRGMVF